MIPNFKSDEGFGLIGVLMSLGVVAVLLSLVLSFLGSTYSFEAKLRASSLTKKSFGGAEQLLINQRQCRCNLLNAPGGASAITFSPTRIPNSITLASIQTYQDPDGCVANKNVDFILSDTSPAANYYVKASAIAINQIVQVIPKLLYRANVDITPVWGRPVSFPILMATDPTNAAGTQVIIKICGVDRAS